MSFEFIYRSSWYKYEDGHIKKKYGFDNYDYFCPVLIDLQNQIATIPEDARPIVMEAILHAYFYGVGDGKKEKIREFKRVFSID